MNRQKHKNAKTTKTTTITKKNMTTKTTKITKKTNLSKLTKFPKPLDHQCHKKQQNYPNHQNQIS